MTVQKQDTIWYRDTEFCIEEDEPGVFVPLTEYGIYPVWTSTDCWRGYKATYALVNNKLVVKTILTYLDDVATRQLDKEYMAAEELPTLNGVSPTAIKNFDFNTCYQDVNMPINYSGGMIIANEFLDHIAELQPPYMSCPWWYYKHVIELAFEDGNLIKEHDRSVEMQDIRDKFIAYLAGEDVGPNIYPNIYWEFIRSYHEKPEIDVEQVLSRIATRVEDEPLEFWQDDRIIEKLEKQIELSLEEHDIPMDDEAVEKIKGWIEHQLELNKDADAYADKRAKRIIEEADFFIDHEEYAWPAQVINGALEVEPKRQDLLAKLCEVYFLWGNPDAFVDAAGRLHDATSGESNAEWDKIVIMGQQIAAEHELFSGVSPEKNET